MSQETSASKLPVVGLFFLAIGVIGLAVVIAGRSNMGYQAIFLCCMIYGAWVSVSRAQDPIALRRKASADLTDDDDDDDDDSNSPMISFVLLQDEKRFLEEFVLAKIIQAAWGGEYASGELMTEDGENRVDGFVVGESPLFVVKSPSGAYMIHNSDQPYWESMDEVVNQIDELRLRTAVADHQAWMSVDLIAPSEANQTLSQQYSLVLKLILEIADEGTLAILRPETMEINVWSDDLAARLNEPDAYLMFSRPGNEPAVQIPDQGQSR